MQFADKKKNDDRIIIVTPEYYGGYAASLKNPIDLLNPEWKRKPVAVATASSEPLGAQVNTSLAFSLWKVGVLLVFAL